ncbi:putative C6 transcription factor [Talaromyces proteolyticus]|uniref:C6 transcription factor n=1 Tax=Talaromyces proteolyticus TaxID=1131652 RepID=A0AAD4KZ09_9EURO|nr:putative C6 transcription factor [Talaromyces proteolyticus]KAH8700440.1 putative C6 transcription factor [Talaromyces proteolyticus]
MASVLTESRSPPGSGIAKKKLGAACIHCHRRKVRCDSRAVGFPCSNCRSSGKIDCRLHEKKKRPALRSALNPVPIRPLSLAEPSRTTGQIPAQQALYSAQSSSQGGKQNADSKYLIGKEQTLQNQHPRPQSQSLTGREDRREMDNRLVTLIDEQEPDRREIQRGVRAIYVGHDVSNMSFLLRQQRGDEASYHFAGNEIPRRRLEIGHDQLLQDALTLPEQSLADELVDAYFTNVNRNYPIVDEDQFMTQYRNRDPTDPPPILILQAILLVGARVSRQKQEKEELANVFYRRCKWLFDSRIERNRDILVQAALLLTWHSDTVDDDVAANAHYWVGVAARIATGLGMHRDPVSNTFAAGDRRMWRRVWWILVQFDVLISLSYGRPQAINLEDCDVQSLTEADFIGCGPHVQTDFVIQFAELCSMISYILRERFGLRVSAERRKAILPKADEALANWSLCLPDSLRLRASDMDASSAMLHLTYNNFLILLHRPHPKASAYSEDYGPHDAEICSAAAGVITSIFEELRQRDRIRYIWCSGVFTLFTAMIQVRVELRFSNPVLAINALRRFDSTLHSLRALAECWSSAETILRLFENSKRLQQDLRVVHNEVTEKGDEIRRPSRSADQTTTLSHATIPAPIDSQSIMQSVRDPALNSLPADPGNLARPDSNEVWSPDPSRYDPSSDAFSRDNGVSHVVQQEDSLDQPREYLDWRQLFPFADPEQPGPISIESFPDMEDEWRQLYWEPQMSDLFQEGIWLQ